MAPLGPVEAFAVFLSATERLDIAPFVALLDEDVVLRFPYMGGGRPKECTGRAASAEFLKIISAFFTSLRWVNPTVYATDDPELAIAVATSSATLPTGDHYENDYVLFLRVRDGKVVEYREHFDPARAEAAFQAIGA